MMNFGKGLIKCSRKVHETVYWQFNQRAGRDDDEHTDNDDSGVLSFCPFGVHQVTPAREKSGLGAAELAWECIPF